MDATENEIRSMRVADTIAENCQKSFQNFLESFKDGEQLKYTHEALKMNNLERSSLPISFNDVREYNISLSNHIILLYYRLFPYLCQATKRFINEVLPDTENNGRDYQCYFIDFPVLTSLRDLKTANIGKFVRFRSTVIRSHAVHPELIVGTFKCTDCESVIKSVEQQFIHTKPSTCNNRQCMNRIKFDLKLEDSKFGDFQKLSAQEIQEEVPKGCLPRSIEVVLRNEMVELSQPGDLCEFSGTLVVIPDVSQIASPGCRTLESKPIKSTTGYETGITGLKDLGVRDLTYRMAFLAHHVTVINNRFQSGSNTNSADFGEDEEVTFESLKKRMTDDEMSQVLAMSSDTHLVKNLSSSLFPRIYGNEEVKRGLLLMLFGGVSKQTTEGTKLRGDMNMCIVGDPSTSKSQFLKRMAAFAPRAVYTSGKAATAAGLTAAVVKDRDSSEFVIEPGALLLANNGICCIDEFDKMNVRDQIALHEAMEQQTISITKAGVKASLRARTSVLAAANPIGGRYDRSRSLRQNIALSAPLMSRFDLFFVLVDDCDEKVDMEISKSIFDKIENSKPDVVTTVYTDDEIRRYIAFARCFEPRISIKALLAMVAEYRTMRQRDVRSGTQVGWRVTVRQYESLIRLAEANAKLRFSDFVEELDVVEAARLLARTIVRVEQPDIELLQRDDGSAAIQTNQLDENGVGVADGDQPEDRQALTISYSEYLAMSNEIVSYLRDVEFDSPESGGQVLRSTLVDWYLGTIVDSIADENELVHKKHLVEMVIDRLVNKDHKLLAVHTTQFGTAQSGYEAADPEIASVDDPIICLHPNVALT